jgi:ABC-2 type transport system ATP-binding protein
MNTIEAIEISKTFGSKKAVDNVSFEVRPGEIFGLLGPNGAGKTTSLRIILDIFKPDSGSVSILGGAMQESKKNRIGYLPEERGLYQDIALEQCLLYLASLKGLEKKASQELINTYLERFNLLDYRKKKIKELSKGMQQKAQLITTLVHKPELIIIDEPFSALDPVNTQMVKDLLREQRSLGKTIVMCTHQMHQVEELCDRLVLINQGKTILYGDLSQIQKEYAGHAVIVRSPQLIPENIHCISKIEKINSHGIYKIHLIEHSTSQDLLKELVQHQIFLEQFEIAAPTLDEIFIQVVTSSGEINE